MSSLRHPALVSASGVLPGLRLEEGERILSQVECEALVQRIYSLAQGGGVTDVRIDSWWQGEVRWARNRVSLASDRRNVGLTVGRTVQGIRGSASTNQLDPVSLEAAVRAAELNARLDEGQQGLPGYEAPLPTLPRLTPKIWSEATYNESTEARGALVQQAIEPAEAKGMQSAGYMELRAQSVLRDSNSEHVGRNVLDFDPNGRFNGISLFYKLPYTVATIAQYATRVRDPEGTGSGWAGRSTYDMAVVERDIQAVSERALQKCLASRHPVALEPGHYTVILEPQGVDSLLRTFLTIGLLPRATRVKPEVSGLGEWYDGDDPVFRVHKSKIGKKVFDERITIWHDPTDPELGIIPMEGYVEPITYIKNGVLTDLGYGRDFALRLLHKNLPGEMFPYSYRMNGGMTSIEEMIRTTKRGLLATNLSFSNAQGLERLGGASRDGLWLIEDGKISKAVKNMEFRDSLWRILNSVEQLGVPEPVFAPYTPGKKGVITPTPSIVPPIKVHDVNFTRLLDAV